MNLKTAIAIAVAAAFAAPLAAQASADADRIIVAQQSGGTMQPKDSNPAAPPATFGPGKNDSSTTNTAPKAESDRPASGAAAGGSSSAPITSGTNSADRKPNTPKAESGATARGGFAAIDKNRDGYISRDEARDATWENRFSELDKDNDNRLSQSEFDALQAGAASGTTGAPMTSGSNSADRKPNTPKQ